MPLPDGVRAILRCPRCHERLDDAPDVERLRCPRGHAPLAYGGDVVDASPEGIAAPSIGARAMQSRWLASVYERWWRPVMFGLSTGFRMPSPDEEARLVLERLAGTSTPWLDLSCGPGTITRRLVDAGQPVVALDSSTAMLDRAKEHAPSAVCVRADAAALPFADGAFGAVVNLAALDLYPDAARVVSECARVLAPGGRWIASTFLSPEIVARGGPLRRALASVTGIHAVSASSLATMAERAGLVAFEQVRFGTYVVGWATKRQDAHRPGVSAKR